MTVCRLGNDLHSFAYISSLLHTSTIARMDFQEVCLVGDIPTDIAIDAD